jgi:hypothetical protein
MNIANFNNKLQATNFELKKGTTEILKKNYQFYEDGSIKYIQDVLNPKFDRLNKYDFQGRIKEAKSGGEARGETVALADYSTQLPYRQSYNYNAFTQLTQRNNLHWGIGSWAGQDNNLQYTYQNNRITNIGYTYDADGRSLTSWNGNGAEASYDASGNMHRMLYWNASDIYRYNDGNGRESKRKTTRWITDANGAEYWSETPEYKYYIRSSVLGNEVVSEVDGTGRKEQTIVRAGGSELAIQGVRHHNNNSFEFVQFKHIEPSSVSIRSTDAAGNLNGGWGTEFEPAELDPLGGNVGFSTPYVELIPNPPSDLPDWSYLYNENPLRINGQTVSFTMDGMSLPIAMNPSMLASILSRLRNGAIEVESVSGFGISPMGGLGVIRVDLPDGGGSDLENNVVTIQERYYLEVMSTGDSWNPSSAIMMRELEPPPPPPDELNKGKKASISLSKVNKCLTDMFNGLISNIDIEEGKDGHKATITATLPTDKPAVFTFTTKFDRTGEDLATLYNNENGGVRFLTQSGYTTKRRKDFNWIAKEVLESKYTLIGFQALYLHELGNMIANVFNMPNWEDSYGAENTKYGTDDPDIGQKLENCIFGGRVGLQSGRIGPSREF